MKNRKGVKFAGWLILGIIWFLLMLVNVVNTTMGSGYERKYLIKGYENKDVVLMGSSSIQMWENSVLDMAPLSSENVGISGSVTSQWISWVDKFVLPFQPDSVVIYVGANDIQNLHREPEDVVDDLNALFSKIHTNLPDAHIYYISICVNEFQGDLKHDVLEVNSMIQKDLESMEFADYIDVASELLDENGNVRSDLFRDDRVHLNEAGYDVWTQRIKEALGIETYQEGR